MFKNLKMSQENQIVNYTFQHKILKEYLLHTKKSQMLGIVHFRYVSFGNILIHRKPFHHTCRHVKTLNVETK